MAARRALLVVLTVGLAVGPEPAAAADAKPLGVMRLLPPRDPAGKRLPPTGQAVFEVPCADRDISDWIFCEKA